MMQIIEQTDEEKLAMYMKLPKIKIAGMLIQCNKIIDAKPNAAYYFMGWECPRCRLIHAPFSTACGCPPPSFTSNTIEINYP